MGLRPSTIGAWTLCPKRVEHADEQRKYPSFAMSQGSLLHARIEHKLLGLHDLDFDYTEAYEKIVVDDTDLTPDDHGLPKAQMVGMHVTVDQAYKTWTQHVLPMIEPYGDDIVVEHRLTRDLNDDQLVSGTPDLVIPDERWILDWKSAGRAWKDTKAAGELQPPAYTWLNGWEKARFTFVVCDLSTFKWEPHTVYVTKEQVDAWHKLAWDVNEAIDLEIYPATPSGQSWKGVRGWHCSQKYCAAWQNCDAKHLIADGQANETLLPLPVRNGWKA